MKKTTSFHLEEDILKEIEKYKVDYNLSSRNVAIERMLLERRSLINLQELLLNKEYEPMAVPAPDVILKPTEDSQYTKVGESVDTTYDTMAD